MVAGIFVGGNQTRFGKTFSECPKVVYPLSGTETILSNILFQLDQCGLDTIILYYSDKDLIRTYVENLEAHLRTPIHYSNQRYETLGDYVFANRDIRNITYIFGDMYFPSHELEKYFFGLRKVISNGRFDGAIGVSRERVGDFGVDVAQGHITHIIKDGKAHSYYTCGMFSLIQPKCLKSIQNTSKLTDVFSAICTNGGVLGYVELEGLVDLDTFSESSKIPS